MRIASTSHLAPAPEIVIHRGEAAPVAMPGAAGINDPAARFARVYVTDVFALQGAVAVSYGSKSPDEVKLRFQTYDFAKLASGVLKDTVLGARLVYADADGTPYDMTRPASDWVAYPTNFARNVAAMPNVTAYRWLGNTILFETTSTEARVKLQQLIDRRLDGRVIAYWKGECFGPGCTPDPAPPTGEI